MADTMSVKLVTPTRSYFSGEVTQIVASGADGEFGLMPGHDPWMVALGMGPLTITGADGEQHLFFTNGGFCQVDDDNVVILAEVCEQDNDIDIERAEEAKQRAEERLDSKEPDVDLLRAEAALKRALYRLDIASANK